KAMALSAGGGLFQGHVEERGVPPTHFVVGVVANEARIVAQREDLRRRDLVHPLNYFFIPHIPPWRAHRGAQMQDRSQTFQRVSGNLQKIGVAPAADGCEFPAFEPLQSAVSPSLFIWICVPKSVGR